MTDTPKQLTPKQEADHRKRAQSLLSGLVAQADPQPLFLPRSYFKHFENLGCDMSMCKMMGSIPNG